MPPEGADGAGPLLGALASGRPNGEATGQRVGS